MVGEKGPEAFVPSENGRILPNHTLNAKSQTRGGDTYNFNINAPGGDAASIAREVRRVLRDMSRGQYALLSD